MEDRVGGWLEGEPDVPSKVPEEQASPAGTRFLASEGAGLQLFSSGKGLPAGIYVRSEINAKETFEC